MQIKKRLIIAVLTVSGFVSGMVGCDTEVMDIGDNWVDVRTRVIYTDTSTVKLSSVMLDSIPTSGASHIMAGTSRSEYWGTTTTTSYLTFNKTTDYTYSEDFNFRQSILFDSITLLLRPDSLFAGDTTRLLTLSLHRLRQKVELDDDGYLYGHSSFPYDAKPLADTTFYPRPIRATDFEFRLPDWLGNELIDKLTTNDPDVETEDNFRRYFNGLVLRSADPENNAAIMSYAAADTSCMIRLHFRTYLPERQDHVWNFKVVPSLLFTQVETDRTGTPLEGVTFKNNEIPSEETGNMSFMEGMTGIYTKMEFPFINNLRQLGEHGSVYSARLYVYPLLGTFNRQNYSPLPDNLLMFVSNPNNIVTGAITDRNDQIQGGELNRDEKNISNTYYSYDVTDFISGQMGAYGPNKLHLMMIGSNYGHTLSNLIVGDQSRAQNNVELHITYVVYDER